MVSPMTSDSGQQFVTSFEKGLCPITIIIRWALVMGQHQITPWPHGFWSMRPLNQR